MGHLAAHKMYKYLTTRDQHQGPEESAFYFTVNRQNVFKSQKLLIGRIEIMRSFYLMQVQLHFNWKFY